MPGIRYLGSKARIIAQLSLIIGAPLSSGRFIDLFCGTGVVSQAAAALGWSVVANDHLRSACALAHARLVSHEDAPFSEFGGYARASAALNNAPDLRGFITREYSSSIDGEASRKYFTESNALRIDGIRRHLEDWRTVGLLNEHEYYLLLADLLEATNRVANTAGTYGCYLQKWTPSALKPIHLRVRHLQTRQRPFVVHNTDVENVTAAYADVVYLDPPYTKRQYAAYYHILETIALLDEPPISGMTGLRPWEEKASVFCYKRKALSALTRLIKSLPAHRILLSYSNQGHVNLSDLCSSLNVAGAIKVHHIATIGRYISNAVASTNGRLVKERVIEITRDVSGLPSSSGGFFRNGEQVEMAL